MDCVTVEMDGPIMVVTLNRPEKRNAWNGAMVEAFRRVWIDFAALDDASVCVVRAAGPVFSAGLDFKDPPANDDGALPNTTVPCDKPIIVAVEGACLGMACSLVLMSDIVIADPRASFAYLEATMGFHGGLMAGFAGRMLYKPGLQWILTGEAMAAERAREIGFVNEVVEEGAAFDRAMQLARRIAGNAPLAVRSLKAIALETLPKGPVEQAFAAARMVEAMRTSDDFREGIAALRDRRPARFTGR
ncbi:MAG: enoyl-CoA hydratase-related protein [Candidatus Sphingomonas colombiensis]|nr:enoyl-CoA hydratase-related protein [Sphingomonas sp.]WEK44760.1 MAG: enoyl-CoA hydratase-related protein [Sphingomonas sp.]